MSELPTQEELDEWDIQNKKWKEDQQWLRFAEAAVDSTLVRSTIFGDEDTDNAELAKKCADFADAMVKEAKRRERL